MLKPQIDFSQPPPGRFRGNIGEAFTTEAQWQAWFESYQEFIGHYAAFSEEALIDLLVVGVELGGTTHREKDWRRVVAEVRSLYGGPITYGALSTTGAAPPHGEELRITWWDALDYIGIDRYYRLTTKDDPTVAEMKQAWTVRGHLALLEGLSAQYQKRIIFTEFGYRSADGANKVPGAHGTEANVDLQEQADAYQAAFEVLWGQAVAGRYLLVAVVRPIRTSGERTTTGSRHSASRRRMF